MLSKDLTTFLRRLRDDEDLRQRAFAADDCDTLAALARSLGYTVSATDVLRFQSQQVLRRTDQELAKPQHQLKVRHWGCWLDVV